MVSPQKQTTPIGHHAVFKCQHTTHSIFWRVNGRSVRGNNTHFPSIVRDGYTITYTLTILARPEYNGSVVECIAVGLNERRYAKLSVQGEL